MDPTIIIMFVVMFGFVWLLISRAKKEQKKQLEQRKAALVLGNNVMTTSGFFGRIVDIDGDSVTLESPAGDETVWLKTSIAVQMDIPFAQLTEAEALAEDAAQDQENGETADLTAAAENLDSENPADLTDSNAAKDTAAQVDQPTDQPAAEK